MYVQYKHSVISECTLVGLSVCLIIYFPLIGQNRPIFIENLAYSESVLTE